MSIGLGFVDSFYRRFWDEHFATIIASGGIPVVAGGNSHLDACRYQPSFSELAITVGAIDRRGAPCSFSNFGECIDIWAFGEAIPGASHTGPSDYRFKTGTSMAAPIVTGLVALTLTEDDSLTFDQVKERLIEGSGRMRRCTLDATCYRAAWKCKEVDNEIPVPAPTMNPVAEPTVANEDACCKGRRMRFDTYCAEIRRFKCNLDDDCEWSCSS